MRKYTTAFTLTETLSRVITSCFGTLSTMTRRSTLRICCTTGNTMTTPGPLMPVKRPSVNITPRSYSLSTLMALNSSSRMRTTTINSERHAISVQVSSARLDPQC